MEKRNVVVVIDDDTAFLRGIERLLTLYGFDVEAFGSAEAFESRDQADADEDLCLILDINLNGISGIQLRHRLARSGSSTPIIFITGNDTEVVRDAALAAGCVAYLPKPFTGASLLDAIEQARALRLVER